MVFIVHVHSKSCTFMCMCNQNHVHCKIICGAPTTLTVKGLMMMMTFTFFLVNIVQYIFVYVQATDGAQVPGSQESTSSEINSTRQLEQLRIAAESSPSPNVSTLRLAHGKAAPVKFSNKAAEKLHKIIYEEEEDYEEMRCLKERGLVSGT